MATSFQKFKRLATQCAVAGSPSRSPTTSPAFHLRRRKTLRMLLCRRSPRRRESPDRRRIINSNLPRNNKNLVGHTLKDLFVSSSPPFGKDNGKVTEKMKGKVEVYPSVMNRVAASRRVGSGSSRTGLAGFRFRLLRRAWRPVLVTIPEDDIGEVIGGGYCSPAQNSVETAKTDSARIIPDLNGF